jgi:hypothetical protein
MMARRRIWKRTTLLLDKSTLRDSVLFVTNFGTIVTLLAVLGHNSCVREMVPISDVNVEIRTLTAGLHAL